MDGPVIIEIKERAKIQTYKSGEEMVELVFRGSAKTKVNFSTFDSVTEWITRINNANPNPGRYYLEEPPENIKEVSSIDFWLKYQIKE